MRRSLIVAAVLTTCLAAAWPAAAAGHVVKQFGAGAPGLGDPYFPLAGNGGYDARHYDLDVAYDPPTDVLARRRDDPGQGDAEPLELQPRLRRPDHPLAAGRRAPGHLEPRRGRAHGHAEARPPQGTSASPSSSRYDGVPQVVGSPTLGISGFIPTDDGTIVAGAARGGRHLVPGQRPPARQGLLHVPHHRARGPRGDGQRRARRASAPPRQDDVELGREGADGVLPHDRHDRRVRPARLPPRRHPLLGRDRPRPVRRRRRRAPATQYAISQAADCTYKRLARTISVPAGGAQLSFWVNRDTEQDWDFMFVEAHTVGRRRLDDAARPQRAHQRRHRELVPVRRLAGCIRSSPTTRPTTATARCDPAGTTGEWNAATGASDGYEQWTVDLSAYAGSDVEVSISYASDEVVQGAGVFVDDVDAVHRRRARPRSRTTATRSTAGRVPGAPEGSPGNENDWIFGTVADRAAHARRARPRGARPRSRRSSPSWRASSAATRVVASGGIIDDAEGLGFALETQTRPGLRAGLLHQPGGGRRGRRPRARAPVGGRQPGRGRVAAHLAQRGLRDRTRSGCGASTRASAPRRRSSTSSRRSRPTTRSGRSTIGDPGVDLLFDITIYFRGAMTLHALRQPDRRRRLLPAAAPLGAAQRRRERHDPEFIALAERISGQDLDDFFQTWLFTPEKPAGIEPEGAALRRADTHAAATGAGADQEGEEALASRCLDPRQHVREHLRLLGLVVDLVEEAVVDLQRADVRRERRELVRAADA